MSNSISLNLRFAIAAAAALPPTTSDAQTLVLKPLLDARLREEHVHQDGLLDVDDDAVTARVRAGVVASYRRFGALVEAQGTIAVGDRYFDGIHGLPNQPLIADPENIAIYRLQASYRSPAWAATIGRQRISLDDDRFVDSALFRQNAQTYDAARLEWSITHRLHADVTYAWSVRTVWGIDGVGSRPTSIRGNNVFGELSYKSSVGVITGFAYIADLDDQAVQGFRLSNQTYGARLSGSASISKTVKLSYKLSAARQAAFNRNPSNYLANFYLLDGSIDFGKFRAGAGLEVAGASDGVALTSFQFPVGSGIRYRGWASKFNPTPPDGLRDAYASLAYIRPVAGPLKALTAQAIFHRFESDRLVRHYGNEIDMLVSAKLGRYRVSGRFADYDPDTFATHTRKLWLQLDWAL